MSSKDLAPGTEVRYKPDGSIFVLDRRKEDGGLTEPFPGWWLRDGGGLADYVLDSSNTEWEVV